MLVVQLFRPHSNTTHDSFAFSKELMRGCWQGLLCPFSKILSGTKQMKLYEGKTQILHFQWTSRPSNVDLEFKGIFLYAYDLTDIPAGLWSFLLNKGSHRRGLRTVGGLGVFISPQSVMDDGSIPLLTQQLPSSFQCLLVIALASFKGMKWTNIHQHFRPLGNAVGLWHWRSWSHQYSFPSWMRNRF